MRATCPFIVMLVILLVGFLALAHAAPPTIAITTPTDGATVTRRTWLTVTATPVDDGTIVRVYLMVNGQRLCLLEAAPYTCAWLVPSRSRQYYVIEGYVVDDEGLDGYATAIQVYAP